MAIRRALTESAFLMKFARVVSRCGWTITDRVDAIWSAPHSSQRQPPPRVHHLCDEAVSSARMTLRSITQRAVSKDVQRRLRLGLFWLTLRVAYEWSILDGQVRLVGQPILTTDDTDPHRSTQKRPSVRSVGRLGGWAECLRIDSLQPQPLSSQCLEAACENELLGCRANR